MEAPALMGRGGGVENSGVPETRGAGGGPGAAGLAGAGAGERRARHRAAPFVPTRLPASRSAPPARASARLDGIFSPGPRPAAGPGKPGRTGLGRGPGRGPGRGVLGAEWAGDSREAGGGAAGAGTGRRTAQAGAGWRAAVATGPGNPPLRRGSRGAVSLHTGGMGPRPALRGPRHWGQPGAQAAGFLEEEGGG